MVKKIFFFIIFISLFIKSLLETKSYDFQKGRTFKTNREKVIFDSTEFKIDEEIYFKIKATTFKDDKLGYQFLDVLTDNISDSDNSNIKYVDPIKKAIEKKTKLKTRRYTIKKSKEVMGDMEGKFLILYYKCEGTIEVANITKDGSSSSRLTIVIVVVMIVVSLGFFYFIYYKKKRNKMIILMRLPMMRMARILIINNLIISVIM